MIALSASGRTPFVLGAARAAADAQALTAAVVSSPGSELAGLTDHDIEVVVGPEFVAGSTRLKAGTAQKLVLNAISTVSMIRLGKTYGDLMVDVAGTNEKLLSARSHGRPAGDGRKRRRRRRRPRSGGREREDRNRLAARRGRRRRSAGRTGALGRLYPRRARRGARVRLGVEAALVDGRLLPGDVECEATRSPTSASRARTDAGSRRPVLSTYR